MFESPLRSVGYVDDLLCEEAASMRVEFPLFEGGSGLRREVEVRFSSVLCKHKGHARTGEHEVWRE